MQGEYSQRWTSDSRWAVLLIVLRADEDQRQHRAGHGPLVAAVLVEQTGEDGVHEPEDNGTPKEWGGEEVPPLHCREKRRPKGALEVMTML